MSRFGWNRLWPWLCMAAAGCVVLGFWVFQARYATPPARPRSLVVQVSETTQPEWQPIATLPVPTRSRGSEPQLTPPPRVTPQEQAAAGKRVIVGDIVRALGQAATMGNAKAVEDLTKGLPKYGEAARAAIHEELGRVKDPKAKDALVRALGRLDS